MDVLYKMIEKVRPAKCRTYIVRDNQVLLYCKICDSWKDVEDFSSDRSKAKKDPDNRVLFAVRSECKSCQAKNHLKYLRKNPDRAKTYTERQREARKLKFSGHKRLSV